MIALYPSYPSRPNEPDPAFGWEVQWAKKSGFKIAFVDLELQLGGDVILRRIPEGKHDVIYRGWLIKPSDIKASPLWQELYANVKDILKDREHIEKA